MLLRLPTEVLIILLPILIFSLCFHEFAHGYAAYCLGDHTAARSGRLTLNPIAHLDPIGSLMILFVGFGWAKPVPVNPANFSNPRRDMIKVAFAGPASNLLLAFIGGLIFRFINITQILISSELIQILYIFLYINIALAVFNMLPVAPLDGSQIFGNLISKNNPKLAWKLQYYGPRILFSIIIIGIIVPKLSIIGMIMERVLPPIAYLFSGMWIN